MIKRIGLLLILVLSYYGVSAQSVSGKTFRQDGQQIIVEYAITGAKYYQKFNTAVYVSMDGGRTFTGPLKEVTGDVGFGIEAGSGKTIVWDVLKERPDFGGNVVFDVRATVTEESIPRKFYIGYKGALSAPLGAMLGLTGKTGFYLSARMSPGYLTDYSYQTDGQTIVDYDGSGYYSFTDNQRSRRLSFTGGIQFQIGRSVHIYAGGGYGIYDLIYEIDEFEYSGENTGTAWVRHNGTSFATLEAEAGLMIDLEPLYLSAGVASPGFEFFEPAVSIGFIF